MLSPTLLHPPEPVEMSVTEQQELGYMPLRDDFEKVIAKSVLSHDQIENMKSVTTDVRVQNEKESLACSNFT